MENIKEFQIQRYVAPKTKKKLKDLFWVLLFPIIGMAFIGFGTLYSGAPLFTSTNMTEMFMSMLIILIACFALNTNLNSGRMDFSLGAVGILGTVLAWECLPDKKMENFAVYFLLLSLLFGIIFGFISGLVFVILKIPAIVVSLGMCLIYEGIAYVIRGGGESIEMRGDVCPDLYPMVTNIWFLVIVLVVTSVIMLLLLKYSKFGHDKLSLLFGQKVAVDTGVNEIANALFCYALAGALIALYTFISSVQVVKLDIKTNLGSAMTVMANFLPIFLGGLIAKHSNEVVGLALGVFSVSLFKDGLKRFGVDDSTISLITSLLIFVILTYMVNWTNWMKIIRNKIKNYKLSKYESKKLTD